MTNYDFKNNIFNQDHIESLKNNGIIVLNNVLKIEEHLKIKNDFNEVLLTNLSKEIFNKESDSVIVKKMYKKYHVSSGEIMLTQFPRKFMEILVKHIPLFIS